MITNAPDVRVVGAALLWLRNQYDKTQEAEIDNGEFRKAVLARVDEVLLNMNPEINGADYQRFLEKYPEGKYRGKK